MAELGKSLVFHLKYQPEMTRLYWNEESPDGLEDPEGTMTMVRTVGDASRRQAADFLEECDTVIQKNFNAIAKCHRISKRGNLEKRWSLSCGVWLKGKFRPKLGNWKLLVGVDLVETAGGQVVPWIWAPGKAAGEEQLAHILGPSRVKGRSQDFKWDPGTVALARIAILPEGFEGFEFEKDSLVSQVGEAFATISLQDLKLLMP